MRQRTKNTVAGIVSLFGAGVFVYVLYGSLYGPTTTPDTLSHLSVPFATTTEQVVGRETQTAAPLELPERIEIPRIGLSAHIQHVGLTKGNAIGIPSNYTDAAWYQGGVMPGQFGTAIIDGHLDNGLGFAGVFSSLNTLNEGDIVTVTTERGTRLDFVVDSKEEYPYREVPIDEILKDRGAPRIALITCSGDWIKSERTYNTRYIVYASYLGRGEGG